MAASLPTRISYRIIHIVIVLALLVVPAAGSASGASPRRPSGLTAAEWQGIHRLMAAAGDWQPVSRLDAPDANPDNGLHFGFAVALDGETLVVGAPYDSASKVNAGSVYVFEKPATGWEDVMQYAKLTASDAAQGDQFGYSVAIDGGVIVVGAPYDDSPTIATHGSVYVFVKPGEHWTAMTETARLAASNKAAGDRLGTDVDVSGGTVVAGAPYHDADGKDEQGAVYVFEEPAGGWDAWNSGMHESAELYGWEGMPGDWLGTSVAISGDTIIAGAPNYGVGSPQKVVMGAAYIFREDGGWTSGYEHAKLIASDRAENDNFGRSVAIDGDVAVVGAPGDADDPSPSHARAAYIFRRPPGDWASPTPYTENARLTASDGQYADNFAWSVDISGGIIVAGARFDEVGDQDKQGSVYVFEEPAGGWATHTEDVKLLAPDGVTLDEFGYSVSVSGQTIAIGAPRDDVSPTRVNHGSVYLNEEVEESEWIPTYLPLVIRGW